MLALAPVTFQVEVGGTTDDVHAVPAFDLERRAQGRGKALGLTVDRARRQDVQVSQHVRNFREPLQRVVARRRDQAEALLRVRDRSPEARVHRRQVVLECLLPHFDPEARHLEAAGRSRRHLAELRRPHLDLVGQLADLEGDARSHGPVRFLHEVQLDLAAGPQGVRGHTACQLASLVIHEVHLERRPVDAREVLEAHREGQLPLLVRIEEAPVGVLRPVAAEQVHDPAVGEELAHQATEQQNEHPDVHGEEAQLLD